MNSLQRFSTFYFGGTKENRWVAASSAAWGWLDRMGEEKMGYPQSPKPPDVTVRVTFIDYLTGKTFTAQKVCRIDLPATTQPAK